MHVRFPQVDSISNRNGTSENKTKQIISNFCVPVASNSGDPRHLIYQESGWDFPGNHPVVKILPSNAGSTGSIPGRGAKFTHALWSKKRNIKQKQYCNKFNKNFKNGPHQKILKKTKRKKVPAEMHMKVKRVTYF